MEKCEENVRKVGWDRRKLGVLVLGSEMLIVNYYSISLFDKLVVSAYLAIDYLISVLESFFITFSIIYFYTYFKIQNKVSISLLFFSIKQL